MLDSFDLSYEELKRIDQVCDEFENQLAAGQKPSIEELVNNETDDLIRHHLLANLIASEIDHSATGFNQQNYTIYSNRFSDYQTAVDSVFRDRDLTNMVDDMQKTIISHSSQDPTLRLQPGSSFGKYRIINCIGKGMFGIVYRAYDTELERDVALKLSRFAETESNRVQERFIEEAKSAAQINANGVATIYDLFTDDHRICIVQEFIDGRHCP